MRHRVRTFTLACVLALAPACASLQLGQTRIENPIAAATSLDQRAYALLQTYAVLIEEATDVVRDPVTPLALTRALGQAERMATPAAEALGIAVAAYVRARGDFEAASGQDQTTLEHAALALAITARRLDEAVGAAKAPIAELQSLVRARRG
ncbi:MAG: hypothetical protein ABL864_03185 [Terricaulis sp.]